MNATIGNLLRDHYVDGVFHTHVSLINPMGKFQFNRQDLETLWNSYCEVLKNEEDVILGVAEKPQQFLPILVDIDIKIKEMEGDDIIDKLYTDKHIEHIIQIYQSTLRKIVENCSDDMLICVLLEKDLYSITRNGVTYLKNGFHLHFPGLFLNKMEQEIHLIPRIKEIVTDLKIFEDLGFEESGLLIDKAVCTNPWLMYGGVKEDWMKPYKVTKIFNSEGAEINADKAFRYYQLYDMHEQLIPLKNKVEYNWTRILSVFPFGRATQELKTGLLCPVKERLKNDPVKRYQAKKLSVTRNIEIAVKLLPMLAQFRADDRTEWMTVGWSLYNISEGGPEGLEMWLEFAARCEEKFDENACVYEWDRMEKRDIGIGTLRYYASIDNPEMYQEYKKQEAEAYVEESLDGAHYDIAKIMYAEYGDEFVCADFDRKIWFQFKNHKWEPIQGGIFLRSKLSIDIVQKFCDLGKAFLDKKAACHDKGMEAFYEARGQKAQRIMSNLKTGAFKSAVMGECAEIFFHHRFAQKLDKNKYLIAFENGIYDLKLNIFRSGRPEDYISKNMPIKYREFDDDDPLVLEVVDFFEKIFPDRSIRDYFLDTSSEIFIGGNHRKLVMFWTGDGDNGKSVTQEFFEKMLGPLSIKIPTTLITSKKPPSGSALAELARANGGVRAAWFDEPNRKEVINEGILKHISGNDSIFARDLFEKGKDVEEFHPFFKTFIICNKLPKIDSEDKATWRRSRVIPFESTFCGPDDPAPETYEEQLRQKRFPVDTTLSDRIPQLVEAFAWFLLQRRKKPQNFFAPPKVTAATESYRKRNNIYRQFIEESIDENDPRAVISIIELYSNFKEWHRESLPGYTIPVKNDVKEYFIQLWGDPERGCTWQGYKMKTLTQEIDDGDAVVLGEEDLVVYKDNRPEL